MRYLWFIIIAMSLAACAPAASESTAATSAPQPASPPTPKTPETLTLEDIKFDSYSEDLAKFVRLEMGEQSWSAIDKMRLYFAPEDGTTILSTKTSTFDRADGSVMVYTVSGIQDDSVKAQELFMIFSGPKNAQILAAYGLKQKCQRGDNTTNWQTKLCP